MADRLTQLQDCLDQLLTQMFACVKYIDTYHSFAPIPEQPNMPLEKPEKNDAQGANEGDKPAQAAGAGAGELASPNPDPPELFESRLRELASDLVLKEQQIEALISMLPGVGSSSAAQEARMQTLNAQLRAVEGERREAAKERDRLLRRVDNVVLGVRRP